MKSFQLKLICLLSILFMVTIIVYTYDNIEQFAIEGKELACITIVFAMTWSLITIVTGMITLKYGVAFLILGFPVTNRTIELTYITVGPYMLNIFSITLVILAICSIPKILKVSLIKADLWLIVFLLLSLFPNIFSQYWMLNLRCYITGIIEPVILYFLIRAAFSSSYNYKVLIFSIIGFIFIHWGIIMIEAIRAGGFYKLVMARVEGGFFMPEGGRYFTGGLNEPVQAVMLLMLLLPLFQFNIPHISNRLSQIIAMGIIVEIFISYSRYVIVALIIEMIFAYIISKRMKLNNITYYLKWSVLLMIASSIPIMPQVYSRFGEAPNVGKVQDPNIMGGMLIDNNTVAYLSSTYFAIRMGIDNPFGIGLNNIDIDDISDDKYFLFPNFYFVKTVPIIPHVCTSLTLGIFATIAYIGFLIFLAKKTNDDSISAFDINTKYLSAGLFLSIILNGILLGKMPIGTFGISVSYLSDGTIDTRAFPSNQQILFSFIILSFAALFKISRNITHIKKSGREG